MSNIPYSGNTEILMETEDAIILTKQLIEALREKMPYESLLEQLNLI